MKRYLMLVAFGLLWGGAGQGKAAVVITIQPGIDSFDFLNLSTRTATDFDITLVTITGPGIGDGNGGPPFPFALIKGPKVDGGFQGIEYKGGPGIPPGGTYTHSFPNWPAGTRFVVDFTYPPPPIPGVMLLSAGHFPTEGFTSAAPEPSTLAIFGIGSLGLLSYRWRRKPGCPSR